MITAKEAVNLVDNCDITVNKILEMISNEIIRLANIGERSLNLTTTFPTWPVFEVNKVKYELPVFTPLQKKLEQKLLQAGYQIWINEEIHDLTKSLEIKW